MLKTMQNILKTIFFWIFIDFRYFGFFKNFIKKVGQKLGNNNWIKMKVVMKYNISVVDNLVPITKEETMLKFSKNKSIILDILSNTWHL